MIRLCLILTLHNVESFICTKINTMNNLISMLFCLFLCHSPPKIRSLHLNPYPLPPPIFPFVRHLAFSPSFCHLGLGVNGGTNFPEESMAGLFSPGVNGEPMAPN